MDNIIDKRTKEFALKTLSNDLKIMAAGHEESCVSQKEINANALIEIGGNLVTHDFILEKIKQYDDIKDKNISLYNELSDTKFLLESFRTSLNRRSYEYDKLKEQRDLLLEALKLAKMFMTNNVSEDLEDAANCNAEDAFKIVEEAINKCNTL